MRWKFTVILLLLNIVAAWYLYHVESGNDLQGRLERHSRDIVPAMNNIDQLTIELRGDNGQMQRRVLARQRERWELLEPVRWPANENAVQNILTQLDFLSEQVAIPLADIERSGQSLADFGLSDPRVIIRYRTIDGKEGEVKLGAPTKMGRRLYLLPPAGQEILVVQEELLNAVAMPLSSLRELRIFDIPPFEIQSLAVQAGEQRIRLVKTANNWRFETPVSAPASNDLVENTLNMLYGQQALSLLSESSVNPDLVGLRNPRMRISLGGNNRRQTLLLGAPVPASELPAGSPAQAYARIDDSQSQGTVFTVMEAPFEFLRQAPDQLRERNFMHLDVSKVNSVQIQRGGQSLNLQKLEPSKDNDAITWQAIVGGGSAMVRNEAVSTTEVQKLLSVIGEINAMEFISDSPVASALSDWGLDEPVAQVRIRGLDGIDTTLLLGKNIPEQPYLIYAKTRDSNTVYAVEARILGALQTSPLAYRNRQLDPLPQGARVVGLKIVDLTDESTLYNKQIDPQTQTWPESLADADEQERAAVLGLLGAAQNFTVRDYLSEGTAAPEAMPWRYLLEVSIQTPASDDAAPAQQTRTYLFTERQGLTQIGASQAADLTFTLPETLLKSLTPLTLEAHPPQLPAVTPEQVRDAKLPQLPEQAGDPTPEETPEPAAAAAAPSRPVQLPVAMPQAVEQETAPMPETQAAEAEPATEAEPAALPAEGTPAAEIAL